MTGASNNQKDSFPFFLSFTSFCALHHFRRVWSAPSCYLPWFIPSPLPSSFSSLQGRGVGAGAARASHSLVPVTLVA